MMIYSVLMRYYFVFGVLISEERVFKVKDI